MTWSPPLRFAIAVGTMAIGTLAPQTLHATPACEDPRTDPSPVWPPTGGAGDGGAIEPSASEPPSAPRLRVRPERFRHACADHGYFVFAAVSPPPNVQYRWRVLSADGAAAVVPLRVGPEPWVYAEDGDESLEYGERYLLEVEAVDAAGRVSAPVRVPFEFEQTGDGPRFWLLWLVLFSPILVPALGLLALAVYAGKRFRAARRERHRAP